MRKPPPKPTKHSGPRVPAYAGPALLAVLFIVLTSWTWRKWGDVFVDFGHELYIPWQLAEGRVLYRDIVYFMGPLSQYFNALVFRVLGTSFTTLILVNLAILAGITAGLYSLFARALGRTAATVLCAVFLCVFGFAHYVRVGNYNYVTPYLHEQTHGVALGVLLLVLLERAVRRPAATWTAAAGATLGLTFLTKAEAFVPALAVAVTAGVLLCVTKRPAAKAAAITAATFVGAGLLPVLSAFLFLSAQMPRELAVRGLVGNWVYIFDRSLILADPFYAENLGLAGLRRQVSELGVAIGWLVLFALGALGLERALKGRGREAAIAAGVLATLALALTTGYMSWIQIARPLPLVCAAAAAVYLWLCWRQRAHGELHARFILAMWSVFALASLGKMILRARIEHYGFALAMPGTLLLVALLVFVAPRLLRARGWDGRPWQAVAAAAVVVGVGWLLTLSSYHYRARTVPIGSGGDLIYGFDPRFHPSGAYFAAAVETLEKHTPAGGTLVVMPDGPLLNYVLRRPNPTPYYLITPWEMRAFGGEDAVFARIGPTAPDVFVLTRQDMGEYGPRHFGHDPAYGERTRLWVEAHYELVADIGTVAGSPQVPWMRIYRRRPGMAVSATLPKPRV